MQTKKSYYKLFYADAQLQVRHDKIDIWIFFFLILKLYFWLFFSSEMLNC